MADSFTSYHTLLILGIVLGILIVPWMIPEASEESMFPTSIMELSPLFMLLPVALLLVFHFLASVRNRNLRIEADAGTIHRVSGSPVGVALILALVIAMIMYRSSLQEAWFPTAESD